MPKITILSLSICFCSHLAAQDSLTLQKAVQQAVAYHATVQKAELDIEIMRDRGRMEKSIIYPQITGQANLDYFPVLPTSLIPGDFVNMPGSYVPVRFGQPWQTGGQVTVQQLLYNESYRRAIPARTLSIELSRTLLEKTKEDLAHQIAQLILTIKQTEALTTSLTTNQSRLSALETSVNASVDNGFAVKTDLERVQLATQQLLAQKQQLQDALIYQRDLLGFLIGNPVDSTTAISLEGIVPSQTTSAARAPMLEMRLLDHGMALQRIQLRAVKAEKYPDIRAYATGLVQSQRQDALFFASDSRWFGMGVVGMKAHFPIYDGGRLRQRIKQINNEIRKNEIDRNQLDDLQDIEVRNAIRGITAAQEQITLSKESVRLALAVSEAMRRQYREGTQPLKEVLDAQSALVDAENQLVTKQIAVIQAQLKWMKAAGKSLVTGQ
jgi:outer membrane protein